MGNSLSYETNQYYLEAINPAMKFEWYHKHEPAKMQAAKELFL